MAIEYVPVTAGITVVTVVGKVKASAAEIWTVRKIFLFAGNAYDVLEAMNCTTEMSPPQLDVSAASLTLKVTVLEPAVQIKF